LEKCSELITALTSKQNTLSTLPAGHDFKKKRGRSVVNAHAFVIQKEEVGEEGREIK
jgi:hypothetical protein